MSLPISLYLSCGVRFLIAKFIQDSVRFSFIKSAQEVSSDAEKIRIERNENSIIVKFPYNPDHIARIKTVKGYRWHPDGKYWSVPYSELESLLSVFDGEKIEMDASIWLYELEKELMARKYSRTVKLYLHYNKEFLKFSKKTPYQVSNEDVRDYLYYLSEKKDCSASTLNIAINALKFYYGEILKRRFVYNIRS